MLSERGFPVMREAGIARVLHGAQRCDLQFPDHIK